jgi:hypothetical protein
VPVVLIADDRLYADMQVSTNTVVQLLLEIVMQRLVVSLT